jgi:peptidoglycan/xylan/chitin deacetylase (PgdA/CDA1 family)
MSAWLDSLRAALDEVTAPVTFFFRDDDAGWRDDRLEQLLDLFEDAGVPIDLAAIPEAVSPALARILARRRRAAPRLVRVHQHGFAHRNHEPTGRKCEFGPSRPAHLQLGDVLRGQHLLLERLDGELDPIFTPPWNRCTAETARAVADAGLSVLSRESRAEPLGVDGVCELPVTVDWLRQRAGVRLTAPELGMAVASAARSGKPTGVMLHHAVMDADDRHAVAQLLALLSTTSSVRLATMSELAHAEVAA